jgi:hypothetical protein
MAIVSYTQFVSDLANMLVVPITDVNYQQVLPRVIDDAEQRIYRELDLLNTIIRNPTGALTPNSRDFTFPQFIVVSESINVMTNLNTTPASGRRALVPTAREFIDWVYPDEAACGCCDGSIPQYYAMITDQTIIVGPPPDQPYPLEVIGTIRPTPLSATNPTTYLTLYLPDLFFCEALIFGYGYLKDYGAATDDPRSSASWSQHYQDLWQSASVEEARKKYSSQAWTPKQPQPQQISTPPRQ